MKKPVFCKIEKNLNAENKRIKPTFADGVYCLDILYFG